MTDATPYTVPKEPGRWRAIALAALVHIALLAFLWIGVRWQSETPVTIEAEVWSPETREAAPRPEPVTAPEPEPKPVAAETPKPEPEPVPPPVVKPEPQLPDPQIALEQEKKRKAREEQKRLEEEERQQERLAKKKAEDERLAKQKAEEERQAKLKKEEEERLAKQKKAEEERLAKKKADEKLALEKAENAKKAAAEKQRKQEEAEAQMLAKARDEEMRRLTGAVAGTGGSGDAARSQGVRGDPSYAQRVGAKIKSNISFNAPDDMAGNPAVEYRVDLLPDGSVAGMRKTKSSGVPGFDEAVRRAIEKSQPYPKDKTGSVPSSFIGIHRLKDQ
jgi:colicin import membrane protein